MFEERADEVFARLVAEGVPSAATPSGTASGPAASGPAASSGVPLSAPVQQLLAAVELVVAQTPADLPGPQALADTAAVLAAVEQLHAAALGRVADVDARKLHTLDGAASTGAWVAQQQTSLDRGEVALARRLGSFPLLDAAVRDRRLSVAVAERVGKALAKLRRHVDRPDGLIDGQPAEQVLIGVIGHGVRDLICQHLAGLDDADPRLLALLDQLTAIVDSPASELSRLEAAFVLLAQHLEPHALPDALGTLVDACLPNEHDQRATDAHSNRGFGLRLNADGSGWHITDGDLDLETGELLNTVLQAEMQADPDNPTDTAGYSKLREQGWQSGDPLPDSSSDDINGTDSSGGDADPADGGDNADPADSDPDAGHRPVPRSLRQKRHDALRNGLRRLLDSAALGLRDKATPHLNITVGLDTLHRAPGALPAVAASGARLPTSLVRSWWCDSAATRFVLSLGHRVVESSHTRRTLTAHERTIKKLETGSRCQMAGCRCGNSRKLIPHHADPWASSKTTSIQETVLTCESDHHHIHHGHTLRLKDGRWLNQHGWTDRPDG